MFQFVGSKDHFSNNLLCINPLWNIIKNNPALSYFFQDRTNANFILLKNEGEGLCGGALLLKQKLSVLHKKMREHRVSFIPEKREVWTCTIVLRMESKNFSQHSDFFFESFYQNLYKELLEFGVKKKINFLYMMLEPGEHLCTEALGLWPYVFEIGLHESLDGLFHGILSLEYNRLKRSIKQEKKSSAENIKLAA